MKESMMVSGKRKSAVAKVRIVPGKGNIFFKGSPHLLIPLFHKLALEEPLEIYKEALGKTPSFDFYIKASGGGIEGQIQASRLAIAKALVKHDKSVELKKAFVQYDRSLLVADTRRKEAYKPGDSKARARRQKSYR